MDNKDQDLDKHEMPAGDVKTSVDAGTSPLSNRERKKRERDLGIVPEAAAPVPMTTEQAVRKYRNLISTYLLPGCSEERVKKEYTKTKVNDMLRELEVNFHWDQTFQNERDNMMKRLSITSGEIIGRYKSQMHYKITSAQEDHAQLAGSVGKMKAEKRTLEDEIKNLKRKKAIEKGEFPLSFSEDEGTVPH